MSQHDVPSTTPGSTQSNRHGHPQSDGDTHGPELSAQPSRAAAMQSAGRAPELLAWPKIITHYAIAKGIQAAKGAPGPSGFKTSSEFESNEHEAIGDHVLLKFSSTDPGTRAGTLPFALASGVALTYGQILALGGDFYGVPEKPISDNPVPATFLAAFNTLAGQGSTIAGQVHAILWGVRKEINAVEAAVRAGQQPSTAFTFTLSNGLNVYWGGVTFGRYISLAANNWDHFGTHAVTAYSVGHQVALAQAITASTLPEGQQRPALELAYAMNAFADHYLSDLFSSGHLRTPRKELDQEVSGPAFGGLLAKAMHDEDSANGLNVIDAGGTAWTAYGDTRLFDSVDVQNHARVNAAVQLSANEILSAFLSGVAPTSYQALAMIPNLTSVCDYVNNPQRNSTPMFAVPADGGTLLRRGDVCNRASPVSAMTSSWWGWSTWGMLKTCSGSDVDLPVIGFGSTTPGSTPWAQGPSTQIVQVDLNLSGAGYPSTPVVISSLSAVSNGIYTTGAGILYGLSRTGFRAYVQTELEPAITPTLANSDSWAIAWTGIDPSDAMCGTTKSGDTAWQATSESNVIYIDIDTSGLGLSETPMYFVSLMGISNVLYTRGANIAYNPTPNGFRVYVQYQTGAITPTLANQWGWSVAWRAIESGAPGSGSVPPSAWQQYTKWGNNQLYADITASGFGATPSYFSALSCTANGLYTTGAGIIYGASQTGFRCYLNFDPGNVTPATAVAGNWTLNWFALSAA
jgi:hypothetical protein